MGGIVACNDGHYKVGRFPRRVFLLTLVSLELYITNGTVSNHFTQSWGW
jgi:hypothetical protein